MSDIIRLLPETIANQIAAGEVVPAPAYIVKELLENSIDAGATRIQVEILDAGRSAVQVTDDGKGMSPTDARMAFERHATSKLREIEDLDRLTTMGFRGEALAAIASVCQVQLRTRTAEAELGTELQIEGARVKSAEPCACPVGTTLKAMNIFYNTPGRRKHIEARKESTDLSDIWKEFAKVALANHQVAFALQGAGKYDRQLPATSLKERIIGVGGSKLAKALIPVSYESEFCTIRGFIGTPATAVKSAPQQYLFVNQRFIRHAYFHKAILLAYEKFVPVGTQPHYFLYFTIPAANIDVNIHPQKTDVRFTDGELIFKILGSIVREAFNAHALAPLIDFDNKVSIDIPAYSGRREEVDRLDLDEGQEPRTEGMEGLTPGLGRPMRQTLSGRSYRPQLPELDWSELGESFESRKYDELPEAELFSPAPSTTPSGEQLGGGIRLSQLGAQPTPAAAPSDILLYHGRYAVTQLEDSLALIDLRRALLRVRYEELLLGLSEGSYPSEQPLFPEVLEFSPTELPTAQHIMELLAPLGFDFGDLGKGHYSVVEAPSFMTESAIGFVRLIVADSLETQREDASYVRSFLAEAAAEVQVLKATLPRNPQEARELIEELLGCTESMTTPSGQQIIARLPESFISSLFS